MDLHPQYQQHDNPWLSVAHLPALYSFPAAPWEHRHRQELALREALHSTHMINRQHSVSKNDNNHIVLNPQTLNINLPQAHKSTFQLTSIREADLVSRCLYALEGIPAAVKELQLLAKFFYGQVADRSLHRLPSLWQRSLSTKALGKQLFVIAQAGWARCQLEDFVDFFLNSKTQGASINQLHMDSHTRPGSLDSRQGKKGKKKKKNQQKVNNTREQDLRVSPPYSLVNQAFAKAVKSILQGHLAALNTLTDSVLHRRSRDGSHSISFSCLDEHAGAVIGFPVCDMTLLELQMHTHVLRIQLQALASLCLCKGTAEASESLEWAEHGGWSTERDYADLEKSFGSVIMNFTSFPRGADLLTFLYRQLQEADNVHAELLRYLFSCACEPYLVFVHSWLYRATLKDPYKEFVVQEPNLMASAGSGSQVKTSVSAPCFLEDVRIPLIRSGQQLQVLSKLVEAGVADVTFNTTSYTSNGFRMLESALKAWTELANDSSVFFPFLIFDKEKLDDLVEERKQKRHNLMQEFDCLFSDLHLQSSGQAGSSAQVQANTQDVTPDANAATTEPYIDKNAAGDLRSFIPNGNPRKGEELQVSQVTTECLSHSVLPEQACGLRQRKEATQQHELDSADFLSTREVVEAEHTGSIEAEDRPPSSKSNMGSKQRKRWIEPTEVVILHGQPEEEASLEHLPAEGNLNICGSTQYVTYHDVESALCNILPKEESYELSISDRANSHLHSFPALTEANLQSEMDLKCQVGGPSLQLTLARSQYSGASSFFFSDISLEAVGPEIFGRSYIHKLAQAYKDSNLPQSDCYKKITANFNAVSQKFWSFDDCISDGSFYMNILPSFLFTSASSAAETLSLDTKSVHLPHSEAQNGMEQSKAEGQNFVGSRSNAPNVFGTPTLCNCPPFRSSKAEPLVKFLAETPLERLEEDNRLEPLAKDSQNRQGVPCGGAIWQSYLGLRGHEDMGSVAALGTALESSEVPLEVIVEKCIIQEVLSQYQCISHFSVRLLHQVFGLQDHLAALRRYFFMERGDWAESFTSALYHNAWHPTRPSQRQLEVQMLLEAAVQNSSCQEDDYAERLHVCVEEGGKDFHSDTDNLGHVYINKTSLSAFNFITLGYRLEWPVSLIITSKSLKLYNSTFSFLIRVKLAAHAVGDIWRFLKGLFHGRRQGDTSLKQDWLNTLTLFRQQVDHFVTTLQGHLETQLLHNIWRKFLQALHHKGKDLLDLEILHGLYLQDALHVCFLSEETMSVKTHIEDILQCLLELSACLNILGKQQDGKATLENEKVQFAILEAKTRFESSIQQLFEIAFNRHNHFTLSQFWTRLDFNGFFGSMCSKYFRVQTD